MRRTLIAASLGLILSCTTNFMGQTETPKYELAPIFTSITKPDLFGAKTELGLGGRFTFNLNDYVALEAEGNFFPGKCQNCNDENRGNLTLGLFGVKAGKRFKHFGIFGKARPGVASFSRGDFDVTIIPSPPFTFPVFVFNRHRATHVALDVGGVLELYHTRRVFSRFDAGDTMIRYDSRTIQGFSFDPLTGVVTPFPFTRRGDTRHNFQFSAGVGFRF